MLPSELLEICINELLCLSPIVHLGSLQFIEWMKAFSIHIICTPYYAKSWHRNIHLPMCMNQHHGTGNDYKLVSLHTIHNWFGICYYTTDRILPIFRVRFPVLSPVLPIPSFYLPPFLASHRPSTKGRKGGDSLLCVLAGNMYVCAYGYI